MSQQMNQKGIFSILFNSRHSIQAEKLPYFPALKKRKKASYSRQKGTLESKLQLYKQPHPSPEQQHTTPLPLKTQANSFTMFYFLTIIIFALLTRILIENTL